MMEPTSSEDASTSSVRPSRTTSAGPGNKVGEAADAGPGAPGRHPFQELANQEQEHHHGGLLRSADQHGSYRGDAH